GPEGMGAVDQLESDANQFALHLLLPKPMVEKAFDRIQELDRLAAFFLVPPTVMYSRLIQLGLIAQPSMDFTTAERRVRARDSEPTLAGRELINALADKMAEPSKPAVPRAFAASSYGTMQRQTEQPNLSRETQAEQPARRPVPTPT